MRVVVLEYVGVTKEFAGDEGILQVVDDLSLTIKRGEIVALLGPSGCGKTTLLNMGAQLLKPTRGRVVCPKGTRVAYAFQEPRLLPWKTVEENIRFVQDNFLPEPLGGEIRERILVQTQLSDFRDAYPDELSGGMKQRVEIARALSIQPDLLLMDEPFKSLDPALKLELRSLLLAEHSRQQFALLLVTHDPGEAVLLADRVILLSRRPAQIRTEIALKAPQELRTLADPLLAGWLDEIHGLMVGAQ